MTARDDAIDVIAALRRARPELPPEVVSPASEAAQALLEEILSMRIPEIDLVPTDPVPTDPGPRRPRRSRRPLVLAAATAVAVAGIAAVAVVAATGDGGGGEAVEVGPATGGSVVPGETTTPNDAVVPTTPADTGRLRVSNDSRWEHVPRTRHAETYSWSGDDFVVQKGVDRAGVVGGRPFTCEVDLGALLDQSADAPVDVPYECDETSPPRPRALDIDPATLLDQLAAAGPFTPVGDEEVEGVPTQRRRATNPGATPIDALFLLPIFPEDATVTALEVWVDGDERVRRLDVTTGGVAEAGGTFAEMNSFVWFDLGAPVTIEPPATGEVVTIDSIDDLVEQDLEAEAPDPGDEPELPAVPFPEDELGG